MVIFLFSVQAQVHAPDLRKRVRVDSWSTESELSANPPSPKRAKIDHQPGPPVTRPGGRSRTLSSSSVLSIADSHRSTPSIDSGLGRSFDVPGNSVTPPKGMQVRSFLYVLSYLLGWLVDLIFFVRLLSCYFCSVYCPLRY